MQGKSDPALASTATLADGTYRKVKVKHQNAGGRDILFIERNLSFLKPGGRTAVVLPQGPYNNATDKDLREYLAAHCRILAVVGLHGNAFKPHTGTKTSVLFVQKWNDDPTAEPLCPKMDDYPIFFATMREPSKDSSGDKIYRQAADGTPLLTGVSTPGVTSDQDVPAPTMGGTMGGNPERPEIPCGSREGGGEIGIRTLDTRKRILDFESSAFDHSAISPRTANYTGFERVVAKTWFPQGLLPPFAAPQDATTGPNKNGDRSLRLAVVPATASRGPPRYFLAGGAPFAGGAAAATAAGPICGVTTLPIAFCSAR